jgi:hypothetical protein
MKFSDLLGEPEPERERPETDATEVASPEAEPGSEPITVFAPVPVTPRVDPPRLDPSNPIPPVPPIPAVTPRQDPPVPAVPPLPPLPPLRPHDATAAAPITAPRVPAPSVPPPPTPVTPLTPAPPTPAKPATPSGLLPGGRSGLAELNVRQPPGVATPSADSSVSEQLTGLTEIVDDLLPSSRRGRK